MVRLVTRLAEAFFAMLVTSLARLRTRLVKARARSLTILLDYKTKGVCLFIVSIQVLPFEILRKNF